jgi:signal transduction protein with GAF and PtsI domain
MKSERKAKRPGAAKAKSKTKSKARSKAQSKSAPAKAHAKAERKEARKDAQRVLEGLGVSPGVGIGKVHLRESGEVQVLEYRVPARRVAEEIERVRGAIARSRRQVGKLIAKAERNSAICSRRTSRCSRARA